MESPQTINIATLVDHSRLGAFQWTIFVLCGLCLIMDGFDVQAMGYVAPAVIREFKIPDPQMGLVFSAAFDNGTSGVFLADVPEPTMRFTLMACLSAWLLPRYRRMDNGAP